MGRADSVGAHVAAVLLAGEVVPKGMEVDHLCRVRLCVLRDHLEVVTGLVNNDRSFSISSLNAKKTHCKRGHEFTPANTYVSLDKKGRYGRRCRQCHREVMRTRYRVKRGLTA